MTITAVLFLIAIGLVLMLIEVLVLPGINIAGILGVILIIVAIFFAYTDLGVPVAHYVLVGSVVFMVGSAVLVLRSNTWKNIMLKTEINSKVNNVKENSVACGDQGKTITRLAPVGKVLVNNEQFEARSINAFLNPNTPIEVVKIKGNQLIVKLYNS